MVHMLNTSMQLLYEDDHPDQFDHLPSSMPQADVAKNPFITKNDRALDSTKKQPTKEGICMGKRFLRKSNVDPRPPPIPEKTKTVLDIDPSTPLAHPGMAPPPPKTHYWGRWVSGPGDSVVWRDYPKTVQLNLLKDPKLLPNNVPDVRFWGHWHNRMFPDGRWTTQYTPGKRMDKQLPEGYESPDEVPQPPYDYTVEKSDSLPAQPVGVLPPVESIPPMPGKSPESFQEIYKRPQPIKRGMAHLHSVTVPEEEPDDDEDGDLGRLNAPTMNRLMKGVGYMEKPDDLQNLANPEAVSSIPVGRDRDGNLVMGPMVDPTKSYPAGLPWPCHGENFNPDEDLPRWNPYYNGYYHRKGRHRKGPGGNGDPGGSGGGGGDDSPGGSGYSDAGSTKDGRSDRINTDDYHVGRFAKVKMDPRSYDKLTNEADFQRWYEHTEAIALSQGLDAVLDMDFIPQSKAQAEHFIIQQRFFFTVLMNTVQTIRGKKIVRNFRRKLDGRGAWAELVRHHTTSLQAKILNQNRFSHLSGAKLSPNYEGSHHEWCVDWIQRAEDYNSSVTDKGLRLSHEQLKAMLQNAVQRIQTLNQVKVDDALQALRERKELLQYHDYVELILERAQLSDETRGYFKKRESSYVQRRKANVHHFGGNDSDSEDSTPSLMERGVEDDVDSSDEELVAAVSERSRRPKASSARLPEDVFKGLSSEERTAWIKLPAKLKDTLLALKKSPRKVNVANVEDPDQGDRSDGEDGQEANMSEREKAVAEAHPADTRRMMSKPASSGKKLKSNNAEWKVNTTIFRNDDSGSDEEESSDGEDDTLQSTNEGPSLYPDYRPRQCYAIKACGMKDFHESSSSSDIYCDSGDDTDFRKGD